MDELLAKTNGVPIGDEVPLAAPLGLNGRSVPAGQAPPAEGAEARRRIEVLADAASFEEFGSRGRHRVTAFGMAERRPAGDGVVTGTARVAGRAVGMFAQDPKIMGGSLGELHANKIVRVLDHVERAAVPVVGLLDSGGARIQEGVASLDGYGAIFRRNVQLSGRVPQISVVLGACAGGAVYSPALTDIVIMSEGARMFLTGPKVVKAVTHEDVTPIELGGSAVHSRTSGVAHLVGADPESAIRLAAHVLGYLPDSCWVAPPRRAPVDPAELPALPADPRRAYDVRGVIKAVVDGDSFLELQAGFARNIVIGLARVAGRAVGVVANQPLHKAGTLDIESSEKAARFVRMCDAFGLPLVVLVDTPGFLPGTAQEKRGIIRKGAKLLYAFSEATVPRVTVVLRKAFGGGYIVMNSRSLGADAVFAWPDAELAVIGPDGAVDVVWRRELDREPHRRDELVARYRAEVTAASFSAERLSVDEIIEPGRTRHVVAAALRSLAGAMRPRFRHDNLPQ
ncbi:MAG TPA: acyl-CoA carboxylase subunit beta [Streptosporangiaceae bacterium]|jgi:propionyl-CoA carboxylase beta chain|nr:acyl-CoA carboxylase subunit beta [Streptosporangiaceae bacterium]